jgi:hypothetical protein
MVKFGSVLGGVCGVLPTYGILAKRSKEPSSLFLDTAVLKTPPVGVFEPSQQGVFSNVTPASNTSTPALSAMVYRVWTEERAISCKHIVGHIGSLHQYAIEPGTRDLIEKVGCRSFKSMNPFNVARLIDRAIYIHRLATPIATDYLRCRLWIGASGNFRVLPL